MDAKTRAEKLETVANLTWQIMHLTPVTLMDADHQKWLGQELFIEAKKLRDQSYAEGFRAARDKAKGIAEEYMDEQRIGEAIAQRIGDLQP